MSVRVSTLQRPNLTYLGQAVVTAPRSPRRYGTGSLFVVFAAGFILGGLVVAFQAIVF